MVYLLSSLKTDAWIEVLCGIPPEPLERTLMPVFHVCLVILQNQHLLDDKSQSKSSKNFDEKTY